MSENPRQEAPIVIIGTGLAGYSLARELRKLDKEVPILMLTADDGHSYSKPMLSNGFAKSKTAEQLSMAEPGKMVEQLNVEIRTHAVVTGLDPERHQIVLGDERISYRKLVLAWGADVIHLDLPGNGSSQIQTVNDLTDYRRIRNLLDSCKRVVILGAGLIGCEFANDLICGGYEVSVVAPSSSILPNLLPEVAATPVQQALAEEGVTFHLQRKAISVDEQDGIYQVRLDDDTVLEADIVLSAIGLKPRIALAEKAGIDCRNGIVANRALETSATDVYAMGDCAEVDGHVLLYVLPLMSCARSLARTLSGDYTEVAYGVMPVIVKTPACPVAVCPPPTPVEGQWQIEQADGKSVKALFTNADGDLLGFALTGACVAEKQALAKQLPPLHC